MSDRAPTALGSPGTPAGDPGANRFDKFWGAGEDAATTRRHARASRRCCCRAERSSGLPVRRSLGDASARVGEVVATVRPLDPQRPLSVAEERALRPLLRATRLGRLRSCGDASPRTTSTVPGTDACRGASSPHATSTSTPKSRNRAFDARRRLDEAIAAARECLMISPATAIRRSRTGGRGAIRARRRRWLATPATQATRGGARRPHTPRGQARLHRTQTKRGRASDPGVEAGKGADVVEAADSSVCACRVGAGRIATGQQRMRKRPSAAAW